MSELRLTLPLPPSANHRLMPIRGRMVLAPEHRAWAKRATALARQQIPAGWLPYAGPVQVDLICEVSSLASDVSNRIKSIEDLLTECGVWGDDRQVGTVTAHKTFFRQPNSEPVVYVLVRPMRHPALATRLETAAKAAAKRAQKRKAPAQDANATPPEPAPTKPRTPRTTKPRASQGYGANVVPNVRRGS